MRWTAIVVAALVVIGGVTAAALVSRHKSASPGHLTAANYGAIGPEGIRLENAPALASASSAATGGTVDGVQCNSQEQVAYHIHSHLAVWVDGHLRAIPPGIGTVEPAIQQTKAGAFAGATRCYYWLHTHAQDGIIHIESPTKDTYTLGQFFAIWRQPLSTGRVAGQRGTVTAYVDGKLYKGDPAKITLKSHEDIQLDLGPHPTPHTLTDWSKSQL